MKKICSSGNDRYRIFISLRKSSVVDCVAADGDRIELEEDFTVQVLGTPGHSADEVTYIVTGLPFIGDSVPVTGDIPIYVNKDDFG